MANLRKTRGTTERHKLLAVAKKSFHRAARALDEGISKVEGGGETEAALTPRTVSEYDKALQALLDRIAKIEEMEKKEAGVVNGYALDLDGARDEIQRRLACLAGARTSGEIPE